MTDRELLEQYRREKSPAAFSELARRHVDWIYSIARRRVHDAQLAEDVTQAVFVLLWRKAGGLRKDTVLAAWLFRVTCWACVTANRTEARRRKHERQAAMMQGATQSVSPEQWEEMAPLLEELVGRLREKDRTAVLLRFYQRRSLAEVGAAMGISEAAAEKRVGRAVEKLRRMFEGKGVAVTSGALGVGMGAYTTQAAPVGVVETMVAGAKGTGAVMEIVKGVLHMQTVSKVIAVMSVLVAVGVGGMVWSSGTEVPRPAGTGAATTRATTQEAEVLTPPALGELKTLSVMTVIRDNPPAESEFYYDKSRGLVYHEVYPRGRHVRFDDGQTEWMYRPGAELIGRRPSQQAPRGQLPRKSLMLLSGWTSLGPMRDASKDVEVNGKRCRFYDLTKFPGADADRSKMHVWVDAGNRVRRVQSTGVFEDMVSDIFYDAVIDESKLPTMRPAEGKIVDMDRYLEKLYPLEGALYQKKAAGLVFAVHRAEWGEEGRVHLVCSSRLSEDSWRMLKSVGTYSHYGNLSIGNVHGQLGPERVSRREDLGVLWNSAMQVQYLLWLPESGAERFTIAVSMGAMNELEQMLKGKSEPTSERFVVELELPKPQRVAKAVEFAGEVYETVDRLVPVVDGSVFEVTASAEGNAVPRYCKPLAISREDFVKNVEGRVEQWRRQGPE